MEGDFLGDKRCPACGKRFTVLWPHQWAYKRGKPNAKYYCSWKCLRAADEPTKEWRYEPVKRTKVNLENKKKAVQIALDGGDPIRYLERLGVSDSTQMWWRIKKNLKETDPETWARLPQRSERKDARKEPETPAKEADEPEISLPEAMAGMEKAAEEFFGKCEKMGLKTDKPKQQKITQPVNYDGMTVREVEGLFGRYRRTDIGSATYIDYESKDGADELSMTVEHWKAFIVEIRNAGRILGVDI